MSEIIEGFKFVLEGLTDVISFAITQATKLIESINIGLNSDYEIKKYRAILNRTKSKRIKKKQLTKIKKRLERISK